MKRAVVVISLLVASVLIAPQSANAVTCSSSTAVGHKPLDVAPPTKIAKKLSKTFTLQTNCGDIVISLFGAKAPATNTVLTTLAKAGFYDNSVCHRLTTSGLYVLQCGDPLGTGVGGPKFRFKDENLPKAASNNYPAGTVAMANNGPNSNGSQFFLVYANTSLGPNYTIWGKITKGLDIVQYVASKGVVKGGTDGTPAQKISINSVKVA